MQNNQCRRTSFKTPPIADRALSQSFRREKALEEQKRKRAQRVDLSRSLDTFAGLSLDVDDDPENEPEILHEGVAQLASQLISETIAPESSEGAPFKLTKNKPRKSRKPSANFANKVMYAELLEMNDDQLLVNENGERVYSDGLPGDLETNWVALAPVPRGKRCMAVSNQSSNVPGTVPNTFLKSRLKGRTIMTFPSPLPPATILDCILDDNWKSNGLIHVLDIIRWKGQEIGDCEANFRFWWRDTRLSELVSFSFPFYLSTNYASSSLATPASPQLFPYPTSFLPVPYHLDLSYPALLSTVIPLSQSVRQWTIQLPSPVGAPLQPGELDGSMEIDASNSELHQTAIAEIYPDGLLLYVSQASYESGTSPLSSWVPLISYGESTENPLALFERLVAQRASLSHTQITSGDLASG